MNTRAETRFKLLGVELTPPTTAGLLRMLGFLLLMVFVVQVADALAQQSVWASEGSLALIVGTFSGFLLNECGACFVRHGWRAFVLMIGCSLFIFSAASLVV
jgi:hypothetical protein